MTVAQGGSLLVAGYECWPTTPVGTYTIASENFGLGDPTALTRAIEQVSLDGERITGRRHGNRLLKLLIVVRAATRQGLDLASGALEMATNEDSWQVQWTPPHLASEAPLPVIYEAYRAVTTIEYDVEALDPSYVAGAAFVRAIYIEAPGFPFGKTPAPVVITGTSSAITVDTLDTGPFTTSGGWQLDTSQVIHGAFIADTTDKTQGTQSWSATESGLPAGSLVRLAMPAGHERTVTSLDLTSVGSVTLDIKVFGANIPTSWTMYLVDGGGFHASSTITATLTGGVWNTVSWSQSGFVEPVGFDPTNIVKWRVESSYVSLRSGAPAPVGHIDNLRAFPASSSAVSVANGGVYRFAGVAGTARTSASLLAQAVTTFGSLVAHAAPAEARPDYTPLVPLSATTAPPYTVNLPLYVSSTAGQRWNGTYAVWLGGVTLNGSSARTITVTFSQTPGGPVSVSRSITPATDLHNGLLFLGIINLPFRGTPDGTTDIADGNPGVTVTVTINSGNTADRFSDLLVLDVRGPTVIFTEGNSNAYAAIDEPLATSGVGEVYLGTTASSLFAAPDLALISGGPFTLEPGDNLVVIYSSQGAPTVTATFHPRWLSTRSV